MVRACRAPPWAPSSLIIHVGGEALGGIDLAGVDVFQAADRPDRFEAAIVERCGAVNPLEGVLRPGISLRATLGGEALFDGEVARGARSMDPVRGAVFTVTGYASYQRLRSTCPEERYWQAADGEIAERIGSGLELTSVVERGDRIHAAIARRGDPLRFLRSLAREVGFELAVSGGRLYFLREIPGTGEPLRIDESAGVVSWEETGTVQGGRAVLAGDPRLRPLTAIGATLAGPAPRRYRIVRAIHRMGPRGYTTGIEFLERGLCLAAY